MFIFVVNVKRDVEKLKMRSAFLAKIAFFSIIKNQFKIT